MISTVFQSQLRDVLSAVTGALLTAQGQAAYSLLLALACVAIVAVAAGSLGQSMPQSAFAFTGVSEAVARSAAREAARGRPRFSYDEDSEDEDAPLQQLGIRAIPAPVEPRRLSAPAKTLALAAPAELPALSAPDAPLALMPSGRSPIELPPPGASAGELSAHAVGHGAAPGVSAIKADDDLEWRRMEAAASAAYAANAFRQDSSVDSQLRDRRQEEDAASAAYRAPSLAASLDGSEDDADGLEEPAAPPAAPASAERETPAERDAVPPSSDIAAKPPRPQRWR